MELPVEAPVLSPALITSLSRGEVVVSDVGPTVPGVTAANTPRLLLELARAAAAGSLQPDKVVLAIRASGIEATAETLGEGLADAIWYAWQEVEDSPSGGDAKARLADVAKDALKESLMTKQQLFCVGDGEFFEECGLVVNREGWRKREIRSHTKHVYQQRKFNLLREESEGYAKLATLVNQQASGRLTDATAPAVLAEMKALIGYFDLDPNRCFSVVLDAFTSQPSNDAFLGLMPAFSGDACAQVLGFHFYRCREDSTVQPPRHTKPAPAGLYTAAAKLVQAGYTSLEALLAHLSPSDDDMKTAFQEGTKKMAKGISRIGIISLVSAADTAAPLAPPGLGLRREPSGTLGGGGGAAAGGEAGQGSRRSGLTAEALELAATSYAAPLTSLEAANQKLLLLAALLQIGDWEHAQQLMRWLRALGLSDFAVFPAVGRALCELIGRELAPVYAAACGTDTPQPGALSVQLPPRLLELLVVAGQHLYHDITVLTKLVRCLAAILASNGGVHPVSKATHEQVLEVLTQTVLPAMSLIPGNAGLVYEIWHALQQLPYTDRFCIYADALKEGPKSSPLLTAAAKLAETEVRRILRRVTAPANKKEAKVTMKPLGRMLAKIMHAAPLAVAEQLIRQVMGMPGMVTSIVESLKYLTPMAFDVMTFAVLKQLASPKKKLKDDGVNLEEWYQWLAAFTGLLCKKHGEVEVNALLQYVANQLKSSESLDLLVLKEMVQTMTGHQAVFDVSEGQLDALAGSDTLRAEVITQGEHRSSDKSLQRASARLLAALTHGESAEQRLAMPLLVLLAQQRKLIVLQSQSTHLKLIAELYDKCQEVCTQYAEFLQHALPEADYRALLPSMEELATEYSVEPELIFSFYRPLIRGIAPPAAAGAGTAGAAGDQQEEEGEIGEIGEMSTSPAGGAKGFADAMEEDGQLEAGEVAASGSLVPPPPPPPADAAERWEELEAQVRAMHGASSEAGPWRGLSPTLYTTFWALQLYDLEVPTARYEATINQLRTDIRIARGDIESAKRDAERPPTHYGHGFGFRGPPPGEAAVGPAVDIEQLGKDIERAQAALDKLPGELKVQQANAAVVERRLQCEKGSWVLEGQPARIVLPREFAQYCILPRMLNSPSDAIYCARFLKKVHQLDVPGFNLLNTVNHVMREFGFLVRVCTAREATNFGIFLNEVFALVERWRTKDVFAKECANSQNFLVLSKAAASKAAPPATEAAAEAPAEGAAAGGTAEGKLAEPVAAAAAVVGGLRIVGHREFLNLTHNWQRKLTDEVFSSCLKSGDYMQAKNALLALNRCVRVYPATKHDASRLIDILAPIRDKDPREDLKTLARMYCTGLEMQMRDKARNMVSTREEYAGMPPKKRPARPAASKGPAASDGGKAAAAAAPAKDAKEGSKEAATKEAGKDKAVAPAAAAAGAEGEKRAAGGAKEEGRRTTDSSKGPSLPPGLGGTARGGRREEPARPERERREERRRDERGTAAAAQEGPPPGFGSADKLKHAGSSTELRRGAEQPAPAAAAGGGERERRAQRGRDERPPRPSGRAEEQQRREPAAHEQPAAQPAGREKEKDERKSAAALRAEAPAFVPRDGARASTGSTRAAEEAAAGERDSKRPRREEAPAAAAGTSGKEREREKEQRGGELPAERGSRERPSGRGSDGKEAAAAAAAGSRGERPASVERQHTREEAREGGKEREELHHRPASGERQEREPAAGSKRKREDEPPQAKPAERPNSREGREQQAAAPQREQRERPSGREAAAEEGHRSRRREAAAEAEEARAAARAAATERHHRSKEAEPEPQPSKLAQKSSGGAAAAAAAGEADADSHGSSESDGERGRRDRKRDKKKREKKDKKEKKERRHRKERSVDKEASQQQQKPAEEHEPKRQRREEEMAQLPARLRGRLGSGGLLGAALKGIVQKGGSGRHEERAEDSGRQQRHEEQREERVVREVREVREEREDKGRRRGGRSRR